MRTYSSNLFIEISTMTARRHPRPITPVEFNSISTQTISDAVWRLPWFCQPAPPSAHLRVGCPGTGLGWRATASSSVSVETPRPRSLCLRGAPPAARTLPTAPHRAARPHCCAPVLIRVSHVHYAYVCLSACALSSVLTVRRGVLPLKNEHPEETSRPGERAKPAWGGSDLRHYLGTVFRVSV